MGRLTEDMFFNGGISVIQERNGYRFSIDAVLLAHHVKPHPDDLIVDLGTGCGIIPLILARRHPSITLAGVEIQDDLAELAEQNIKNNGFENRISVMRRDMKTLQQTDFPELPHIVVSNPPYRKEGSGRMNPNSQKAIARHEIKADLADVVLTAKRILRTGGVFYAIYPAERMTDMIIELKSAQIEPKEIRLVYSNLNTTAKLFLIEGIKQGRSGVTIRPPLVIYQSSREYSEEVSNMFRL